MTSVPTEQKYPKKKNFKIETRDSVPKRFDADIQISDPNPSPDGSVEGSSRSETRLPSGTPTENRAGIERKWTAYFLVIAR
jgi:hypothetical protein